MGSAMGSAVPTVMVVQTKAGVTIDGKEFCLSSHHTSGSVCVTDGVCEFRPTITQEQRNGVLIDPNGWLRNCEYQEFIIAKFSPLIGATMRNVARPEKTTTIRSISVQVAEGRSQVNLNPSSLIDINRDGMEVNRTLQLQASILNRQHILESVECMPCPLLDIIVSYAKFPTLVVKQDQWAPLQNWFGLNPASGKSGKVQTANDEWMLLKHRNYGVVVDAHQIDDWFRHALLTLYSTPHGFTLCVTS